MDGDPPTSGLMATCTSSSDESVMEGTCNERRRRLAMNNERLSCCETMTECPCETVWRRNRTKAIAALAGAGLVFLLLQAGWILGVIAFFRTL